MKLAELTVGKPFPGKIIDGIMFDLFAVGGSLLRIGGDAWQASEIKQLKKGAPKVTIEDAGSVINFTFSFGGFEYGTAPFDVIAARDHSNLELPDMDQNSRILITLVVVDTDTNIVKALRAFTLHPRHSMRIAELVMDKLSA